MKANIIITLATLLTSTCAAAGDDKPNVIVEPFFANWCARQWPDEMKDFNSYSMVHMMAHGKHEKIEPWIGKWCFEQFPELGILDENEAIDDLYTNHEQLEPFLEVWGTNSLEKATDASATGGDLIDIEPYIGYWCAEQFPQQLEDLKPTLHADIQADHVKFEPALARWCFASFPDELKTLDESTTVEGLKTNHELVENDLILWTLTTNAARGKANLPTASSSGSDGGGNGLEVAVIVLSVLLALSLMSLLYVTRGRWMPLKQEQNVSRVMPRAPMS